MLLDHGDVGMQLSDPPVERTDDDTSRTTQQLQGIRLDECYDVLDAPLWESQEVIRCF